MRITDGSTNVAANVNGDNQVSVKSECQSHAAFVAFEKEETYIATAEDAGPVAAEYPMWLKYTGSDKLVVDKIIVSNVDADVVWKIHTFTGTGATAAVVTPVNTHINSGNDSETTCRGGAGGVSALTIVNTLHSFFGGAAYSTTEFNTDGTIVLSRNDAIGVEYDAGTGGKVEVTIMFHIEA